jgi:hypothetical protein
VGGRARVFAGERVFSRIFFAFGERRVRRAKV